MTNQIEHHSLRRTLTAVAALAALMVAMMLPTQRAAAVEPPGVAAPASSLDASAVTIDNDQFWKDTAGNPIFSQGGGIFDFPNPTTGVITHYWYGVHYVEAESYYANPTKKYDWASVDGRGFVSVDVYSSLDLKNWKFENSVLTESELAQMDGGAAGWFGRLGVTYIASTHKYAMLVQENNTVTGNGQLLALTADSPTGKFSNPNRIDMHNFGLAYDSTGDQTVFNDDDGQGYLVYSKPSGRDKLFVAQIVGASDGTVTLGTYKQIYAGAGREGDCMFKYNGKYYFTASDLYGWNASNAYFLVSDSIFGTYQPVNNMGTMRYATNDYSHVSQTGFYYTLHGSKQDTVIFAGDRWADFAGNGLGYNQWVPLSFDGTAPVFNSLSSWDLNPATGEWQVGKVNNYVVNPAFEADRVAASPVRGWTYAGTTAAIVNQGDNSGRVGNFQLAFTSANPFSATATQNLATNPAIAPPDGTYTLSAWARHTITDPAAGFTIGVTSGTDSSTLDIKSAVGSTWQQVTLKNIRISGGVATLSISTSNVPGGQWANIDDIALTRNSSENTALASVSVAGVPVDVAELNSGGAASATVPSTRSISPADVSVATADAGAQVAVTVAGGTTAADEPTISIVVTPESGPSRTYVVHVAAQSIAVPVSGVRLDRSDYWFTSDYFAATSLGAPPTATLTSTVLPANATNTDVTWTSSSPSVAKVDAGGGVTALRPGTSVITATTVDGAFAATTLVHVPAFSESFDQLPAGSGWIGTKVPAYAGYGAGTVTADGARGNDYSISMGGTGLRALEVPLPAAVSSDTVDVDLDWNVGTPTNSNGAYLAIADASGRRYLTLTRTNGGQLTVASGGVSGDTSVPGGAPLGSAFAANDTWYTIHAEVGMKTKSVRLAVTNLVSNTSVSTVVPLAAIAYDGSVKNIDFVSTRAAGTMSWTTKIDKLAAYGVASPSAIEIASPPAKTVYAVGEPLDTQGLVVDQIIAGGRVALTAGQYVLSGFDSSTPGPGTVTASLASDLSKTSSFAISVSKVTQSIGFPSLSDQTVGGQDFAVNAAADSGLPVALNSDGSCTLEGDTVHIIGAGSCSITASQAGNGIYAPAMSVTRTFTIAQGEQVIDFAPLDDRTFGDGDFPVSAATDSGLPLGLTAAGSCTIAGTAVHLIQPGTCTITASQPGDANYKPAEPVARTFAVAPGVVTLKLSDVSSSWGVAAVLPISVSATAGPATGQVKVMEGSTDRGTVDLMDGKATVSLPSGAAGGIHHLTVSYLGSDYLASASATVTVTVELPSTWQETNPYRTGDRVSFAGEVYQAAWYSKGEQPGASATGAWQQLSLTEDGKTVWTASKIFNGGDRVVYLGKTYRAGWYTRNELPGAVTGPWEEIAVASDGTAIWTASRIFNAGDIVVYNGMTYVARWYNRDQSPTQGDGAWRMAN